MTKGSRFDGKKSDIGLRVRANQERADKMWVLEVCNSRQVAISREAYFAYQYGIPMLVFRADPNRSMALQQTQIDAIFKATDTEARAYNLLQDLSMHVKYPHFVPQATTRQRRARVNVNIVLFGDKRQTMASQWSASRISANTTNARDLELFNKHGYAIRPGRNGTVPLGSP